MAELTVPQVDFSTLGNLGKIYNESRQDAVRQRTLAELGQGDKIDPRVLLASGDLSLANLGVQIQNRQQEQERQARLDQRQTGRDAVDDRFREESLRLQKAAAARASEDKFAIKEVVDPNTGATTLVRVKTTGGEGPIPLGLPSSSASGTNPKSPFNQALFKADAERVNSYSEGAKLAEEGSATLDTIDNLRKSAFTAPVIGPLAARLGHPATQALEASTNSLALDVAKKMKGSLSDKDIVFLKSQVPTAATGGAAGEQASGAIRAGFERTKQRAQFYRTWAEQNGNINGADAAWSKYSQENPLTVEDKDALGGRRFNPNYNKDFSPYLRSRQPQQTQGITQQQYDALPSGSTFTAPDGTQRVKP